MRTETGKQGKKVTIKAHKLDGRLFRLSAFPEAAKRTEGLNRKSLPAR
ncbi:MAG: hypothetical protein HFG76_05225 [Hungatella sp.]|nr:hypothetical protein [Hungatella sp.]MCI9635339.1 hypothetical protein [Hungatella sp.]